MHIAFFNRSYYPDNAATGQLLTDLCEDLVRDHGCRVTVVTGPPLMPSTTGPRPMAQGPNRKGMLRLFSREEHNGVQILRARGTRFDKRRFAGRATNYMTYFLAACWAGLRLDRPQVVVALTDPPIIGLAAWLAGKRVGAPLVMSYRDLFPEVTVLLEDFHSDTINGALQRVNRFLCRKAARVIALGDTMKSRLIDDKGAAPAKTVIIPDWADTTAIVPGPKKNAFADRHGLADKFVVMHSGNIGLSQSLETVIEAAALLRDVPDLQVVFQGEGVKKADLQARAQTLGLSTVSFLPFAAKNALGESFAVADIFIVSLQRGLAGYIVPSKLYGILAAGRPYVAAVEDGCEVAAIARSRQCGLVAEPSNARDLADKILTFYRDRDLTRRYGANAREAGLVFDRTVQVRNYMELFKSLIGDPAPARGGQGSGREMASTDSGARSRRLRPLGFQSDAHRASPNRPDFARLSDVALEILTSSGTASSLSLIAPVRVGLLPARAPSPFRSSLHVSKPPRLQASSKRVLDVTLASAGILASLPLWALIAAAIKLEDGGPVFYAQDRVGQGGRVFRVLKFRSMIPDAEARVGALQASAGDPRITRVGRWLRATAMDELPQLLAIARGDMSFVGPRALRPGEIEVQGDGRHVPLEDVPGFRARCEVRPGLTGVAQIYAARDIPRRQKFLYDKLYIRQQSFWLDIRLILLSFWITFRGTWEVRGTKF